MMVTTTLDTPVGELRLFATERGLHCVAWPRQAKATRASRVAIEEPEHPVLQRASRELREYFGGSRERFEVPLDPVGTPFQREAWRALLAIPYGETWTYQEQASAIGRPRAARAVGSANGKNPLSILVPCHRVVGSNGSLTGFAGGIETKRFLLEHEAAVRDQRWPRARTSRRP